jgi:hypothetical protein
LSQNQGKTLKTLTDNCTNLDRQLNIVKKNQKNVYKSEHICKCCVYSQKQKQFIMNKEQIIDLLKAQEAELYTELLELRAAFGATDRGTLNTQARWGAIVNILDTIEENENN